MHNQSTLSFPLLNLELFLLSHSLSACLSQPRLEPARRSAGNRAGRRKSSGWAPTGVSLRARSPLSVYKSIPAQVYRYAYLYHTHKLLQGSLTPTHTGAARPPQGGQREGRRGHGAAPLCAPPPGCARALAGRKRSRSAASPQRWGGRGGGAILAEPCRELRDPSERRVRWVRGWMA